MGVNAAEVGLDECIGDKGSVGGGNPDLLETALVNDARRAAAMGIDRTSFMGYRLILAKREAVLRAVWVFFIRGTTWWQCR